MTYAMLELPIQMQIAIGVGFLSYLLAFVGLSSDHRTVDTVSWSIMFSAVFLFSGTLFDTSLSAATTLGGSTALTLALALLWRWQLRKWMARVGQLLKVSRSDGLDKPEIWMLDQHRPVTQLTVRLKDGTELFCSSVYEYQDLVMNSGPRFNADGSIVMHVDQVIHPGGSQERSVQDLDVHDPEHGTDTWVIRGDQIAWYVARIK